MLDLDGLADLDRALCRDATHASQPVSAAAATTPAPQSVEETRCPHLRALERA